MSTDKGPADPIDARLVRRLATILNDTGLTEIEVERGELRIRVARQLQQLHDASQCSGASVNIAYGDCTTLRTSGRLRHEILRQDLKGADTNCLLSTRRLSGNERAAKRAVGRC